MKQKDRKAQGWTDKRERGRKRQRRERQSITAAPFKVERKIVGCFGF